MKALTIKQPWADAIVYGIKRVENRTWGTRYRGALAIHAGKAVDLDGVAFVRGCDRTAVNFPDQRGAFIGLATLHDAHPARPGCCPGNPYAERGDGLWHWLVRAPVALVEPVPFKGQLGLWQLRDQVAEQVVTAARGRRDVRQFL